MFKLSMNIVVNLTKARSITFPTVVRTYTAVNSNRILFSNIKNVEQNQLLVRSFRRSSGPDRKVGLGGWLLLVVPMTTFGLGVWQIQRKLWKEGLIKEMEQKTSAQPVPIPDNLMDMNLMEYSPVVVRGQFLHDKELHMGPRSYMENGDTTSKSSLFSDKNSRIGFLVVTPFKLEGRDETILVNRGWVPKNQQNQENRLAGQVQGTVEVVGIVRLNETRPPLAPESKGKHFLYRDLKKMCKLTGADPYFIDAKVESNVPGGPIGGQTRVTLRNEHLSYIITWFCLSGATSWVWFRQIFKGLLPI